VAVDPLPAAIRPFGLVGFWFGFLAQDGLVGLGW
jgi:hypothetical protein